MRTGKITKQDEENRYTPCLDCDDHVVSLDSGTDIDFHRCEKCNCKARLKEDFKVIYD